MGIVPGGGGTQYLASRVGRSRALEVVLSADLYDAETAERYGWVNRAVPADELDDVVDRLARNIAALPEGVIAAANAPSSPMTWPKVSCGSTTPGRPRSFAPRPSRSSAADWPTVPRPPTASAIWKDCSGDWRDRTQTRAPRTHPVSCRSRPRAAR